MSKLNNVRHFPFIKYGNDISMHKSVENALIESDMYWEPKIADIDAMTIKQEVNGRTERNSVITDGYRLIYRAYEGGEIYPIAPVRSRYTPSDPISNFMEFDEWVRKGRMALISGGNFENKFLWMFAEIKGADVKIGKDEIKWHMIAYDNLCGGEAHVIFMPLRSYCDNGLFVLDSGGKIFELKQVHVGERILTISEKIGAIMNQFDYYHHIFYAMQEDRYAANVAKNVYEKYVRNVMFNDDVKIDAISTRRRNILQTVNEMAEREAEHNGHYSLWGIYNAVIEYADHVYPDAAKAQKNIYNLVLGHGSRIKKNAWKEAVAILN